LTINYQGLDNSINNDIINIQNDKGMAKVYQVRQVLAAIDKLEAKNEPEE
jgi:hypothetical protein